MNISGIAQETFQREWITGQWKAAADAGTLLTARHDPTGLARTFGGYRTILVPELAANLQSFISSESYVIDYYQQKVSGHGAYYYVLTPTDPQYSVAGSGVLSRSQTPTGQCDRLVVVSGKDTSWHLHAEKQTKIDTAIASGNLTYLKTL